ncbi:type IV secretion system protein [Sedimentitalea sp. HM32M-2]|uniref:type IV secretion system protein n=1 Tax=Sedimentitalea sp. HM32M-2 TaxID=3351566 RepID=UPI00363D0D88
MGIVSFIMDAANAGLNDVAESQFAAVASGLGGAVVVASTLAVALLFINMALQIRPMDGAELFPLLIKIGLINAFAFNWVNFNYVSNLVFLGLENVAGLLIGSITGDTGSGSDYFANRFDQMIDELADYANAIGSNLNWMAGAIMSVVLTFLLSILGGAAALVLVLAKMVVTLLIGIAPAMIMLSLFKPTNDYFSRWLAAVLSWSLYPVVIAGVFSVIFGLMRVLQTAVGSPDSASNIGAAIPFLALILLSLTLIAFIPAIVRTLSGDINAGLVGSLAGGAARKFGLRGEAHSARQVGAQSRSVPPNVQSTASPRTVTLAPQSASAVSSMGAGSRMLRMKERSDRLSKLK